MFYPPTSQTSNNNKSMILKANEFQCKLPAVKKKHSDDTLQPVRIRNICQPNDEAQKGKRASLQGGYSSKRLDTDAVGSVNGLGGEFKITESVCSNMEPKSAWTPQHKRATASISSSQSKLEPPEDFFLDLESLRFVREDEDSASDLSDSERIPIPSSPLAPPKLNLKAEQIAPGYFDDHLDSKGADYNYPDVLPPPFSSWNLPQLAAFVNTEGKHTMPPAASGFPGRYIDRLLQLEWLQMQTVEAEKSKACKSRPQTAPRMPLNGKTPGRIKPWSNSLPIKQSSHPDDSKSTKGPEYNCHKKYPCHDVPTQSGARRSSTMVGLSAVQKQTQDGRFVTKKRQSGGCQQAKDLAAVGNKPKIQSFGNIRPAKLTSAAESTTKLIKSTSNVRTNGSASVKHVTAKQSGGERKLKSGTVKPTSNKEKTSQ
ncbi:protein FAM217B [Spea bombifrons]|uniref:protein FAM217B n=1 Tax=Spea bombifrons TaxID=233779 RepID=UPI00234B5189|nr:protein FAM217B [Spea bombifrons]